MQRTPSTHRPSPAQKSPRQRYAPLALSLAVVGVLALVFFAMSSNRGSGGDPRRRDVFDPQTTNSQELRRVAEAVSRIIAAPRDQHEVSVATLEAVRAESPGARDLKDACVSTYRGMIRAQSYQRELRELIGDDDAGMAAGVARDPTARDRAAELFRLASEQIEVVQQSRDRCMDLYGLAVSRLGLSRPRGAVR